MSVELDPPPRSNGASRIPLIVAGIVGVVVVLAVVFAGRFGTDPKDVSSPLVGRPAPAFDLQQLEGNTSISLADLRGRVVLVNFWASWCVPCRAEHSELTRLANDYTVRGVEVLGIVHQDTAAGAVDFLNQRGRAYDQVVDPTGATAIDYGLFGVPETFLIDRAGTIVAKFTGAVTYSEVAPKLEALLGA